MVSTIMAGLYTMLALVALVLALAWFRQDPLGFVFVVVLGLPWTFFLSAAVDGAGGAPRQALAPSRPRLDARSLALAVGRVAPTPGRILVIRITTRNPAS